MAFLPSFNVKDVADLFKKGATIEAQEKIMELRQAAIDLQEENSRLRDQLKEAERKLELRGLKFERSAYWTENDGPYCQPCADSKGLLIRLQSADNSQWWFCHVCKGNFRKNPDEPLKPARLVRG